MNRKEHDDLIYRIMNDPERVGMIIQSAINDALLMHKIAGNPVCGIKNGKVYWVQPEDIVIKEIKPNH